MERTNNNSRLKMGVFIFLGLLVFSVFYAVLKSNRAETKALETQQKVDHRYTSYDNLFFHTNSIVVDSSGNKIGEVYILTNDIEIDSFYSDSTRNKTMYYHNLINRKLKIKEKPLE